ncbi:MAG: hypothetical protein KJ042_01760 [Deltaproteobacteria bacterium]|nr:hypothetical protein [Deltaproteobacteria bacterium]
MGKIDFGKAFEQGWAGFSKNIVAMIVASLVAGLISMTVILMPPMLAGLSIMGLRAARGEQVEINDVFAGFQKFGRYWGAFALMFLIALPVVLLTCGIGGLVIGGVYLFSFLLLADRDQTVGEMLSTSWNFFKSDWLMAIVLALTTGLINSVGGSIGIGALVTVPFGMCVIGAAYVQVFDEIVPATRPVATPI